MSGDGYDIDAAIRGPRSKSSNHGSSYLSCGLLDLSVSYMPIDNTIAIDRIESAINYPDFLFPFLFFRAPPTVLQPAASAISRARFGCRPFN